MRRLKDAFQAGLIATLPMTIMMYGVAVLRIPHMDIFRILGGAFTSVKALILPLGAVIHFLLGGIFSVGYLLVWWLGIGRVNNRWGMVFGTVHGLISHTVMKTLLPHHPRRPHNYVSGRSVVYILVHTLYGILVARFIR